MAASTLLHWDKSGVYDDAPKLPDDVLILPAINKNFILLVLRTVKQSGRLSLLLLQYKYPNIVKRR